MKFVVVTQVRPNSISLPGYQIENKSVWIAGTGIGATCQIRWINTPIWTRQHLSQGTTRWPSTAPSGDLSQQANTSLLQSS